MGHPPYALDLFSPNKSRVPESIKKSPKTKNLSQIPELIPVDYESGFLSFTFNGRKKRHV